MSSHWRLTDVSDARGTTEIPESVDAWLELAADGRLLASDDVNVINGAFGATSVGFDVTDAGSTLVGYGGNAAVELAAITGIGAMTIAEGGQAVHVTVLSADHEHLTVQASGVRLTFVRTRSAGKENTPGFRYMLRSRGGKSLESSTKAPQGHERLAARDREKTGVGSEHSRRQMCAPHTERRNPSTRR